LAAVKNVDSISLCRLALQSMARLHVLGGLVVVVVHSQLAGARLREHELDGAPSTKDSVPTNNTSAFAGCEVVGDVGLPVDAVVDAPGESRVISAIGGRLDNKRDPASLQEGR
jgi:hypothetical protein